MPGSVTAGRHVPPQPAEAVTAELLNQTRPLSVTATTLLALQVVGNLYEEVVTNAQTVTSPRPGALPGELDPGSPVFFYMPWVAVGASAAVALRVRHGRHAPRHVRQAWDQALGCLAVVAIIKTVLITQVNPLFRDPSVNAELLRNRARWWAVGNGVAVVAGAAAIGLLTRWRRAPLAEH